MMTLLLMAGILAANLLVYALVLVLGACWLGTDKPYLGRALLATVLIIAVNVAQGFGIGLLPLPFPVGEGVELAFSVLLSVFLIGVFLGARPGRAMLLYLLGLAPIGASLALLFVVVRPYVLEAFVVPTNPMAPAILGWHSEPACPACGKALIVPRPSPEEMQLFPELDGPQRRPGICTACRTPSEVEFTASPTLPPDRIFVNKLLTPRRWDVVAFTYPQEALRLSPHLVTRPGQPPVKVLARVVGLPWETVFIKDGAIWVGNAKVEPPLSLAGLVYLTDSDGLPLQHGTAADLWRLAQDEYCVLGDFSARSFDSRMWGPLPGSHIEGVVAVTYWPASRWKIHR